MRASRSSKHDASHPAPARAGFLWSWNDVPDLALATAAALVAAVAMATLPTGDGWRLALTLPVLFFAPGYLLIQALVVPRRALAMRAVHAALAVGVSPAIVGLVALGTVLLPGGFRAGNIVTVVTLTCLLLAAVALLRRSYGTGLRAELSVAPVDAA